MFRQNSTRAASNKLKKKFVSLNVYFLDIRREDSYSERCNKKQPQNSSLVPVNGILIRRAQRFFLSAILAIRNFVVINRRHSDLEGRFSLYFIQKIRNKIRFKMQNDRFN